MGYSDAALLRRVRREMATGGVQAEARLITNPFPESGRARRLVEVTATAADRTATSQHDVWRDPRKALALRIAYQARPDVVPTLPDRHEVEQVLDHQDALLGEPADRTHLVMREPYGAEGSARLLRRFTFHDMAGASEDQVVSWPIGGDANPLQWLGEPLQWLLAERRRRRQLRRGFVASGALLDALGRLEGPEAAGTILDHLAAALRRSPTDIHVSMVDAAEFEMGAVGVRVAKGRATLRLAIIPTPHGDVAYRGRRMTLPVHVPETMAAGLAGTALGEIMEDPPLPAGTIVRSARCVKAGLSVETATPDAILTGP